MIANKSPAVEAKDLSKDFASLRAVDSVNITIPRGICFGFLGPNGAGKTTLIRMVSCRIPPSSGTLKVLGMDPTKDARKIKAMIGVVPQGDVLDPNLTVRENLAIYGLYYGMGKRVWTVVDELLDFMELRDKASCRVDALSGGMKRRLTIARAMLNHPEMVILDEPTTGLDPHSRLLLWQKLRALKERGVTLLLTTHYMEEAARLCDQIGIIHKGKIIAEGAPGDLVSRFAGRTVVEIRLTNGQRFSTTGRDERPSEDIAGVLARLSDVVKSWGRVGDTVFIRTNDSRAVLSRMEQAGIELGDYTVRNAHLEDVFLQLTGRELRE